MEFWLAYSPMTRVGDPPEMHSGSGKLKGLWEKGTREPTEGY